MLVLGADIEDIARHGEAARVFGMNWAVVPFKCHAGKAGAINFFNDFVVLLESLAMMIQVGIANVLNGKVLNDECKHDGVPLVAPEPGGGGCLVGGCLVVVTFSKGVLEEVVSKDACLGGTVHATAHFKLDPGVTGKFVELVLVNEFSGDVRKLDVDVLWPVERGVEIEVLKVHGAKPSIALGEKTVDEQFDKFNQACGVTYISRICNVVATNGDACTVGIISLLWLDFANDLGVGDFLAAVNWDLVIRNGEEGVGAFDVLALVGTGANALA
jgi:hypothetical protein